MIMNIRKRPRRLEFIEAGLGRIRPNHPAVPIMEADRGKYEAGLYGEKILDSYLEYLPDKDYYIFQGLRLANEKNIHFQIDSLIISPTHLPIIESKNLAGNIEIDENNDQLIQNGEIVYENPMIQAQFQLSELRKWLKRHHFPYQNLEYLVGMMNKNCLLKTKPGSEAQYRVCRGRRVVYRLKEFAARYKVVVYSPEVIKKLCKLLIKKNIEPSFDIEKIYKISKSELRPGVHCPSCKCIAMEYRVGSWHCQKCGCKSKNAHLKALKDYYLLFGPEITNHQFREFLLLDSISIASKMLKKLNFPYTGTYKNRVYRLSFDIK